MTCLCDEDETCLNADCSRHGAGQRGPHGFAWPPVGPGPLGSDELQSARRAFKELEGELQENYPWREFREENIGRLAAAIYAVHGEGYTAEDVANRAEGICAILAHRCGIKVVD